MAQKEGKNAPSSKREAARNILVLPISEVRPYEKNPRKNSGAVKYVKVED